LNLGPQLPADEFNQGSILIVEDDRALRNILAVRLRAFGFQVFESDNGETGIQMARVESPDLIIMDVGLP
jgi:DNA-binding response OmpR family regulator